LATQGTTDTINPPGATSAFYDSAAVPKYLLALLGASHLPPYSVQAPALTVVERVTIAVLDHYLKHRPGSLHRLTNAGNVAGLATAHRHPMTGVPATGCAAASRLVARPGSPSL
jgi:hypothetical protein